MQKYDIFISYRRQGGEAIARDLCERFTDMGYKVFYDVESLSFGDFDKTLYSVVENCRDFLIILSPGALDQCENYGDWVRNELAYALEHEKNVVPVMLRGFDFPEILPGDIAAVRYKSGIEVSTQLFDAFIDKLRGFLKSKPSVFRRLAQNRLVRKTLTFLTALVILCAVFAGGYTLYEKFWPKTFSYTQAQKNITNELLEDLSSVLFDYNNIVLLERRALEQCSEYLASENPEALENALTAIDQSISEISKADKSKAVISVYLSNKLDDAPINKSEVLMFMSDYNAYIDEATGNLHFIKFVINDSVYESDIKKKIVGLYTQQNDLTAKFAVYYSNAVTINIDSNFLSDFRESLLPLTALPYEGYIWLDSMDELEDQVTINLNKQDVIVNELISIVIDQHVQDTSEVEEYITKLKETQKRIETITTAKGNMKSAKDEARAEYSPTASDDGNGLWNKMLHFLLFDMPDDARTCLDAYYNKVGDSNANAAAYAAAKEFIYGIGRTGVDYGVLVRGFEDNAVHEIYRPGDIIVAVNGLRCLNFDSYTRLNVKPGDRITILRYQSGKPVFTVETLVSNQPITWLASLTKREDEESAKPLEELSSDRLWERMTENVGDFAAQEAIDCAQTYHMRVRWEDKNTDIYIPTIIALIKNIADTNINYGVVVTTSNGDGLGSPITGDIIIAVDGQPCLNLDDYASFDVGVGSVITVKRKNLNAFDTVDIQIDRQPVITVKNISTMVNR